MWLIVPLGNPGVACTTTRHNLGRLMVTRWMDANCLPSLTSNHKLRSGNIYSISHSIRVLIPNTYMNTSGMACKEAVAAGYSSQQLIVVYDDKDLLLGSGRFRLT